MSGERLQRRVHLMGADEDGGQVVTARRLLDHRHRYPPDGRAAFLGELHPVRAQGGQAFAPGEERDVVPGLVQAGRRGTALGDHVPDGGDERAADRGLTTRHGHGPAGGVGGQPGGGTAGGVCSSRGGAGRTPAARSAGRGIAPAVLRGPARKLVARTCPVVAARPGNRFRGLPCRGRCLLSPGASRPATSPVAFGRVRADKRVYPPAPSHVSRCRRLVSRRSPGPIEARRRLSSGGSSAPRGHHLRPTPPGPAGAGSPQAYGAPEGDVGVHAGHADVVAGLVGVDLLAAAEVDRHVFVGVGAVEDDVPRFQ